VKTANVLWDAGERLLPTRILLSVFCPCFVRERGVTLHDAT